MKRLLILWTIGLACAVAYAAYDAVQLYATGIGTGGTAATDTSGTVHGKVIALNINVSTTMQVQVTTTAGKGASLSGAKTILAYTDVTGGTDLSTNLAATTYLYGDTIVLSCRSSTTAAATCRMQVILDR